MIRQHQRPEEYTALSDRMGYLLLLRIAMASVAVTWSAIRPEALGTPFAVLAAVSVSYVVVAALAELLRRRATRYGFAVLSTLLILDGLYLAYAMYVTGATQSPIRFLIYLHLVAVSLLASYRTGLKIALWHSLLLFVVLYGQAAGLFPPVDVIPGRGIDFDRMPVLNVTSFWLFALATSIFSAMNERELRQRRADLQALVDVGARLDEVADPALQARVVLDGMAARFGFERGLVIGAAEGSLVVLASRGATEWSGSEPPDAIIRRAWERRELLPVKRISPEGNPLLTAALPNAHNLLVSPMIADGRPVGAIVVEHRSRTVFGVERRVASVLGQFSAVAALNLRNAVLLRHVQDLAEQDSLTGAANRRMFQRTLERTLEAQPTGETGAERITAVLFIDLDDFKIVNDSMGHAAGDELLVAVTDRIRGLVRQGDLVARLGGDEFAILTGDLPDLRRSRAMAERLVRDLRVPYVLSGKTVTVTASIGIASARDAGSDAQEVVRNADVAMYMAKANGKSGFAIFDPGMHAAIRARHELGAELQHAVDLGQLRLVYQPIVSLESGRISGLEALVRWQHPERGIVAPGEFIEIAEENGAILPIGRWVMREACERAVAWQKSRADTTRAVPLRERVRPRDPAARVRRLGGGDAGLGRARADTPDPGDHRDRTDQGNVDDGLHPRGASRARRASRHRRLRHRILLAEPPAPVPGRRPQDRRRVRAGRRRRLPVGRAGRRDRGTRRVARDRDRRRGDRDEGARRADALPWLHLRPGLLLREADRRRGDRGRDGGPRHASQMAAGRRAGEGPAEAADAADGAQPGLRRRGDFG